MAEPRSSRRLSCLPAAILLMRAMLAPADAAQAPTPTGTGSPPQAAAPAPDAPAQTRPPGPPAAPPPMPSPPPVVPAGTPAEIDGDRADAIAHDIVLHPPQKQVPQQDSAHLRTVKLKLDELLDRSVHGAENSEVGRVIDVMVGDDGKPAALVLDVGGFMGVGNRKIAVAWSLFDLTKPRSEPLRLALTEAQVKSAPASADPGMVTVVTGADAPAARPAAAAISATVPTAAGMTAPAPAPPAPAPHAAQAGPDATGTPDPPQPDPGRPTPATGAPDHPPPVAQPRPDMPAPKQPWHAGTPPPPDEQSPSADGRL